MVICFRRDLFLESRPFVKYLGHDEWINIVAPCFGRSIYLDKKLVYYRRHDNNTSGNHLSITNRIRVYDKKSWFTHPDDVLAAYTEYLRRYKAKVPKELKKTLSDQIIFQTVISDIVHNGSIISGIHLIIQFIIGRYSKYRGTWKTLILDQVYLFSRIFIRS